MKKIRTIFWTFLFGIFALSTRADVLPVDYNEPSIPTIEEFLERFGGPQMLLIPYLFLAFISFWILAPLHWKNKKKLFAISLIAPVVFYAGIFLINVIGKAFYEYRINRPVCGDWYSTCDSRTAWIDYAALFRKLSFLVSFPVLFLLGTTFFYSQKLSQAYQEKNKVKLIAKLMTPCLLKTVVFGLWVFTMIRNATELSFVLFCVALLLIDILSVLFVFHKKWSYLAIHAASFCLGLFYMFAFSLIGQVKISDIYVEEFSFMPLLLLFPMIDMIFIRGVFCKSWKYYVAHISLYTLLFVLYSLPFYLI